ncbi:MAG TPA: GNAT family N-acetyltransferase [Arthrobacter sp.]|nr:GNAT family N-acetyltransferase [Arthrobacter sp.]
MGFAVSGPSFGPEGQEPPRVRQLFSIYVAEEHHGAGAGQALLDSTVGDGDAMLWVAKDNPRAVAFHLRNGFEFDGIEQADPGAPKIVDARMVR